MVRGFLLFTLTLLFASSAIASPSVPANIAGSISSTTVTLTWDAAPASEQVEGYNVYRNNQYVDTVLSNQYTGTVEADTLYSFTVVAFSAEPREYSPVSESISLPQNLVPTDLTIPPSTPTDLTGTITGSEVTLDWTASTDDEAVQGYNIYENNQYLTTVLSPGYTGPVVPGDSYSWYVIAFDTRTNFSGQSNKLRLPDTGPVDTTIPPSVPTALSGTTNGVGTAASTELTWTASTDDQEIAGYNIYRDNQYIDTVFANTYDTTIDTDTFTNFNVVAFDYDGNFSAASDTITLPEITDPTALTEPPSTPQALTGGIVGTDVSISWTASTDNLGVAGYNVYENNSYIDTVSSPAWSGTVVADATYTYYVVAFDFNGNFSDPSSALQLPEGGPAPSAEAPSVAENLIGSLVEENGTYTVSLAWDPSTDDEAVAGYNIYQNNQYLTTVNSTTYEGTVGSAGPYSYFVVAFDIPRNFSDPSERLSLPTDENQPPFFEGFEDQTIDAGPVWELVVRPMDIDGGTPGLFGGTLPEGMQSIDNFDGTRTLRWQPLQPAIGDHQITFTAFDNADSSLQTTRTITLTVVMPDDPSIIPNPGPTIDAVGDYTVRYGDTVVMRVKAVDANGTIPELVLLNPPPGSTFETFPLDERVRVLRWTTDASYLGTYTFNFEATDADDPSLTFQSSVDLNIADPSDYVLPGSRLRDLADQRNFLFGYASLLEWYNQPDGDLYGDIAAAEFNMVSTENSMKWGYINPEPGEYRWIGADNLIAFAEEHNMVVHGHPLIWYTILPPWVMNSPVDEREAMMNTFIDDVVTRYNDNVQIWDVVNEAFEDDGSYRNSVWFQAMGEDYIAKAFTRARANAPTAKLLYNDYDVSFDGPKSDAMYQLMETLLADGVPIDGVGFQMHLPSNFNRFDEVAANFQRFADLGLEVYVTELDVIMEPGTTQEDQANVFSGALSACLAQPACQATQIWGFTDRYSWLRGRDALVLDDNYQPKPAYGALQSVLENP